MDTYTVVLIVLAVIVVGGFSYFLLRPEKSENDRLIEAASAGGLLHSCARRDLCHQQAKLLRRRTRQMFTAAVLIGADIAGWRTGSVLIPRGGHSGDTNPMALLRL
jgi:hypothetical protein